MNPSILFMCAMIFARIHESELFLMYTTVAPTLSAHDFRQLLDLLVEEKHFRSLLEDRVSVLEKDNRHTMTSQSLLNQTLIKERSKYEHLEQAYLKLELKFNNLSINHSAILERNKQLEKALLNLSKFSQNRIDSLDRNIKDINKSKSEQMDIEKARISSINRTVNGRITRIDSNITSLSNAFQHQKQRLSIIEADNKAINLSVVTNQADILANRDEIAMNRDNVTANREAMLLNRANITANKQAISTISSSLQNQSSSKTGYQIGFTVTGDSSSARAHPTVKTNIGSGYNARIRAFICSHPGMYYFTLSLIKQTGQEHVHCNIRINGVNHMYTATYQSHSANGGFYGTSTSLVLHLSNGDRVDLGDCSQQGSIAGYSSFSGFLIRAD